MKIAIIGIRGIPIIYSGFETFTEVLTIELAKLGHQTSVYCRSKYIPIDKKNYKGVKLISLPSIEKKNFGTFSHSFISTIHACLIGKYDIIFYLGAGNTPFSIIPRFFGIKTIVHIDGLDWRRKKWGIIARIYLKLSEWLTTALPNRVVTDSQYMVKYYKSKYHKDIDCIPYGYFPKSEYKNSWILKKYNLKKRMYFTWVGRIVPENFLEELIYSFTRLKKHTIKCVVIGDDLYESSYKERVCRLMKRDKRVIHTGFIKHSEELSLVADSLAYIETKRSGGTHPSLIEAMGAGTLVVSNDNETNKEVLIDTAIYYSNKSGAKNLAKAIERIVLQKESFNNYRKAVKKRAEKYYSWNKIIRQYENLFTKLSN